jgi:hypothetical protein
MRLLANPLPTNFCITGSAELKVKTELSGLIWPSNLIPVNVYDPSVAVQLPSWVMLPFRGFTSYLPLQVSSNVLTGLLPEGNGVS